MKDKIINSFDIWIAAQGIKSRLRIKNVDNISLEGIARLRELILELAVRGKLVKQDVKDERANILLKRIDAEFDRLVEEGKIKGRKELPEIGEETTLFQLPNGWTWAFIPQIVKPEKYAIKRGPFGSSLRKDFFVSSGFKIYEQQHAINNDFSIGEYYIDKKKFNELSAFEVKPNDVIISCSGTVGKVAVAPESMEPGIINQALLKLTLNEDALLNNYFKILFPSFYMKTETLSDLQGTAQKNMVSVDTLKSEPFPLPPLAEQHRIVAKVNELMSLCDELEQQETNHLKSHQLLVETLLGTLTTAADAKEFQTAWSSLAQHFDDLFKTEDSIDQLKQTILQLAVMGKLVPQDPKDEPASVLLKKIAEEKERLIEEKRIKKGKDQPEIQPSELPFKIPTTWEFARLGEVTNYGSRDQVEPASIDKNEWVLELEDIEKITSNLIQRVYAKDRVPQSSRNKFYTGDVLYGKLRPYLDKVIVADGDGVCTTEMIPLRGYTAISSEFLRLVLKSPYFVSYASESTHGMNLPRLGTDKARLALIPIAPVNEQARIVTKVEELFALCDRLKEGIVESQKVVNLMAEAVLEQV